LFFLQNGGSESTRLEGFVTSDIGQFNQDRFHYTGKIGSPVSDVVVELKSPRTFRYTETSPNGRFIFDGLTAGDYQLSVLDLGDRRKMQALSGPTQVHVTAGACPSLNLLVLTRQFNH
jgi:hypothetical protein